MLLLLLSRLYYDALCSLLFTLVVVVPTHRHLPSLPAHTICRRWYPFRHRTLEHNQTRNCVHPPPLSRTHSYMYTYVHPVSPTPPIKHVPYSTYSVGICVCILSLLNVLRHCRDARVYVHRTTAMHDVSVPRPPLLRCAPCIFFYHEKGTALFFSLRRVASKLRLPTLGTRGSLYHAIFENSIPDARTVLRIEPVTSL